MTTRFVHKDDCFIERREDALQGKVADLFTADGDKLWTFPGDMSDQMIMSAVAFGNHAYAKDVQQGEAAKVYEIKACLGISQ